MENSTNTNDDHFNTNTVTSTESVLFNFQLTRVFFGRVTLHFEYLFDPLGVSDNNGSNVTHNSTVDLPTRVSSSNTRNYENSFPCNSKLNAQIWWLFVFRPAISGSNGHHQLTD
jgi:hypothetical protein